MKIPLRFQVTESDCGAFAIINAFSYLYEREEIPAELIHFIYTYTLDRYDTNGNLGAAGTSKEAIKALINLINNYAENNNFNVFGQVFEKEEVTEELIRKYIKNHSVIIARVWQTCEHYATITNIDDEYVYIFDPYYLDDTYYDKDKEVEIVFDKPFEYNRKIKVERLFNTTKKDFSFVEVNKRELIVITKTER